MNDDDKIRFFLGQVQMFITLLVRNHSGCNSPAFRGLTDLELFYNEGVKEIFEKDN